MTDTSISTKYTYSPLDSSERQIRPLKLLPQNPTSWQTTIDCEIFTANLDDKPEYEALSYVWGSQNKPYHVRAEGKALAITSNLFSALMHLRKEKPRVLWIDAICIDQNSVVERNHQVSMMLDVYSSAASTTVWLGDFSFLPVHGSVDFLGCIEAFTRTEIPRVAISDAEIRNMRKVLENSWFTRIWIVLELACSNSVHVQAGHERLSWGTLVNWNRELSWYERRQPSQLGTSQTTNRPLGNILALNRLRTAFRDGQRSRLVSLMFDLHSFESTIDVDMVYAVRGLSSDQLDPNTAIPVDYDLSFGVLRDHLMVKNMGHHTVYNTMMTGGLIQRLETTKLPVSTKTEHDFMSDAPPKDVSELPSLLFPPTRFAPFFRDWVIQQPSDSSPTGAGKSAHFISYIQGWLIGYTLTPLGWLQLVYMDERLTGRVPSFVLLIKSSTSTSYYCLEAFRTSAVHEDRIARRMTHFFGSGAMGQPREITRWKHVVPAILMRRIDQLNSPKPWQEKTFMSAEQLELWNHIMMQGKEWHIPCSKTPFIVRATY